MPECCVCLRLKLISFTLLCCWTCFDTTISFGDAGPSSFLVMDPQLDVTHVMSQPGALMTLAAFSATEDSLMVRALADTCWTGRKPSFFCSKHAVVLTASTISSDVLNYYPSWAVCNPVTQLF